MKWNSVKTHPLPIDKLIIGITQDWVMIGKKWDKVDDTCIEHYDGYNYLHSIEYWHEIPELPWQEEGEWFHNDDWVDCKISQPPRFYSHAVQFIIFDEIDGIMEAEYWGGYQNDTCSSKRYFKKPLFWRPFPKFPISTEGDYILQW